MLVVGGGNVAEGKVQGLLAAHARVTVVAPHLSKTLANLETAGEIDCMPREYESATSKARRLLRRHGRWRRQRAVAAEGKRRGIWVNAADDPKNCDFILPSVVRQGDVVVAASTGGASPALARRLREDLTAFLAEDYAPLAELLADVRREIRTRQPHGRQRDMAERHRRPRPRPRGAAAHRRGARLSFEKPGRRASAARPEA